jgi:hypothetical protein
MKFSELKTVIINTEDATLAGKEQYRLAPAEAEYVDALVGIARKWGKLADNDENGIWVGYESRKENEHYSIGVRCENCAFYKTKNECLIVKRAIEPGGYCRLAAIRPGLVTKKKK